MIKLWGMNDKSGSAFHPGGVVLELENGVSFYENTEDESELIIWIPDALRPREYELQRMCGEKNGDKDVMTNIFLPQRLVYDEGTGECCGYTARKPQFTGQLKSLHDFIARKRCYDRQERVDNAIAGLKMAGIFKAIKDSENGYTIGTISRDSFWMDDANNVYYAETFLCSQNLIVNENSYYMAPELLMSDTCKGNFSAKTDAFVFALLLFQILTGKFPFNSAHDLDESDLEYIWGLMCDGNSVFFDRTDECSIELLEELSHYSERIQELFRNAFDYCGRLDYA